jgi:O-antigen/teichoic acid export membrane protein
VVTTDASAFSGRRLTADIAVQIVGRILNLALGVVVTVVVVRTLGQHRFGQWSTLFAISDLLGYLGEFGIDKVVVRQAASEREREPEYLGTLVWLRTLLAIPVTLAFLAITLVIASDAPMRISAVVLAVLLLLPPLSSLSVVFQLRVRNDLSMLFITVNSVLWTGSAVAVAVLSGGIVAMSVAFVGAMVLMVAIQTLAVRRLATVRIRGSRPLWGQVAKFALPVGVALSLTFAYGRIDQVLVFQLAGASAAGIYGAMYRILTTTTFVPTAVFTTLFPILSASDPARMRRLLQLAMEYLAMISLPILAFVLVAAEPVIRLLFGEDFVSGADALRVLMGAFVVICFGYVAGSMVIVLRLQRIFVRYALLALVFNVVLNLIFVPKYGYIAAAWITLGTELLVETLALRAVFRAIGMRPSPGKAVRILAAVVAMGLILLALHSAGAGLVWLVLAALATYPALLLGVGALTRSDIAVLLRRETPV